MSCSSHIFCSYPFWDPSLGPASPATYAAGTGTVEYANVQLLKSLKNGFKLSADGSFMSLAVQIPRSAIPYGNFDIVVDFSSHWWKFLSLT